MSLSTRLILLLTITVSSVMAAAGFLMLRQQESELKEAARSELRAHALTLQIALEEDYRTGRTLDAQRLIERLSENAGVVGAQLFDAQGRVTIKSSTLSNEQSHSAEAQQAITTGTSIEQMRNIGGTEVFSVIAPIRTGAQRVGALEIIQPISFVKSEIRHARRDMALSTLLVCAAMFLVVLLVMRSNLMQPIRVLLEGALAFGSGNLAHRVQVSRSSGELSVLADEFNRMASYLSAQRQIAAREAEERLELERQLRHSEQLAAVGRLAAGVAHEMGAPLQVIDGRARQLLDRPEVPLETRQRNLTIIRTQSERIARIVREMLNLSRPYNLQRVITNLSTLVGEALESVELSAARAQVQIEFTESNSSPVEVDPDLLHQVLLNILNNSIQATAPGGRLRVHFLTDQWQRDGRTFTAVRISDTGTGIAPEVLPYIFDPFFTTKEVGQGTGLGLAVSRRIIEEHGGWIEAGNQEGGGAVFTIFLPRAESAVSDSGQGHRKVHTTL